MSGARNGHLQLDQVPLERRVRELRRRLGWTQQQLADEVGVNVRQVKRWESGTVPSEDSAVALAEVTPRSWRVRPDLLHEPVSERIEALAELRAEVEELKERVRRLEDEVL